MSRVEPNTKTTPSHSPFVERPLVLGTAGHIDHGKTTLVKALTGVDCDRLKEEKARGITIELGFAPLVTLSGRRMGVVDVPGHERFVRTMIAGTGGIDIALLVVAADTGVMPQTVEHMAICELLGIRNAVVAITKCDLVDTDRHEALKAVLYDKLKGTVFGDAPFVHVSATTGLGVKELLRAIDSVALTVDPVGKARRGQLPSRLPIDRVFTMAGFGVVVTGTLASGRFQVGDEVGLMPSGAVARIRGLEVHGARVTSVDSGQRVAMNLQGLDRATIRRGDTIAVPNTFVETQVFDVEVVHLPYSERPLPQGARLAFHVGTSNCSAAVRFVGTDRLEPGARGFAQVHTDRPIVVAGGDRFVLRGTEVLRNHGKTVGGGVVLDARAPVIRKRAKVVAKEWSTLLSGSIAEKIGVLAARVSLSGFDDASSRIRLGLTCEEWTVGIEHLEKNGAIVRVDDFGHRHISAVVAEALIREIEKRLDAFHRANPTKPGESVASLMQSLHISSPEVMSTVVQLAVRGNRLDQSHDRISLRGRAQEATDSTATTRKAILAFYEKFGLSSPRIREVSEALKLPAKDVEELVSQEVAAGRLVRISTEFVAAMTIVKALEERLMAHLKRHGSITTQEFKELAGVTRKHAIPLAEFFDARRVTLRVGEKRIAR